MLLALVGLPASGKTTVFNVLAGAAEPVGAYETRPGTKVAAVHVPDGRIEFLSKLLKPKKTTLAAFDLADVVGMFSGEANRREVDASVLAKVREADALVYVIRAFPDAAVPHVAGSVDPVRDVSDVRAELLLADLEQVERRIERLKAKTKKGTAEREADEGELATLIAIASDLERELPVRSRPLSAEEERALRGFRFLTAKAEMILLNGNEASGLDAAVLARVAEAAPGIESIIFAGKLETELAELPGEERGEFRDGSTGTVQPVAPGAVIRKMFALPGLITFFTIESGQLRAWPLGRGSTAVDAAGTIHTDMARGFIRAEVMAFENLEKHGDVKALRAKGLARTEGKDYVVRDGDVVTVRFSA